MPQFSAASTRSWVLTGQSSMWAATMSATRITPAMPSASRVWWRSIASAIRACTPQRAEQAPRRDHREMAPFEPRARRVRVPGVEHRLEEGADGEYIGEGEDAIR